MSKKAPVATVTRTNEEVIKGLAEVKARVGGALEAISNEMQTELKKLGDVKGEIALAKDELADVHGVQHEVGLSEQMSVSRAEQLKRQVEENVERAKQRQRDEEQYAYEFAKKKRDERDKFDAELAKLKSEAQAHINVGWDNVTAKSKLADEALAASAVAVARAEKAMADAAKEKDTAVAIACNSLKKDLTHAFEVERLNLRNISDKLTVQRDQLLELSETQQADIVELKTQLSDANKRVQEIASRAIDGAASAKVVVQQQASETAQRR